MNHEPRKAWLFKILPDLVAFGTGLGVAWFLNWNTTDLVWSLWLSSLSVGYLTLLATLAAGAYYGVAMLRHPDFKPQHRTPGILFACLGGGFFLVFFSLHFCGFHAGHSVFLKFFFPLPGLPGDGFGRAFVNPPLLWFLTFKHLMLPYGIFLLPAIIAERKYIFGRLLEAHQAVRAGLVSPDFEKDAEESPRSRKKNTIGEAMARPYVNVVRMHILIFFFALCHFLKIESFLVFAVVYSVYFFPWKELKEIRGTKHAQETAA